MAGFKEVFRRSEIKYLLSAEQYKQVREYLDTIAEVDAYGLSRINNIYFDTRDYRLIRTSLQKPVYKEKLRLRTYGQTEDDTNSFIEIKKKYKGVVYKRRISGRYADNYRYLTRQGKRTENSQIAGEIDQTIQMYPGLVPAMSICYDRIAMAGKEEPGLRITFDRNIRWSRHGLTLTAPPVGRQLLAEGESLLEIKTAGAMPLWLTKVLTEGRIRQISFSKYGLAYETGLMNHTIPARQYQLQENGGYCYV